jgi:hypothetical protein
MSDAAEPDAPDADAWATACEEDLAAEKARRRAVYGTQFGSPAEELRRLADAVSEKVAELGKPFGATIASAAAQGVAQQLIAQARAAIEPVVERNPEVFDHIAAAGGELLAAYRAAVQEAEGRWTATAPGAADPAAPDAAVIPGELAGTAAPAGLERIDLDVDSDASAEPGASAEPETSAEPKVSAEPEASAEPEGPDVPEAPHAHDASDGTDETDGSEAAGSTDVHDAPDAPDAPDVTDAPGVTEAAPGEQPGSSGSASGD